MKIIPSLIVLFLIPVIFTAQELGELTIPLTSPDKIGKLEVDVRQGSVEVRGTNRKDVWIKYIRHNNDDCSGCEEATKSGLKRLRNNNLDLEITEEDNHIEIESSAWNRGADLVIEVPKKFNISLDSYLGDLISVQGISGEINLEGYTGDLRGVGLSGFVSASTYSGNIEIQIVSINSDKPMAFSNYSGNIDLTFPANFKSDLKLQTKWGDVFSSYDLEVDDTRPELKEVEKGKKFKLVADNWIYGKINGGGPETVIKSTSGNIYLRKSE